MSTLAADLAQDLAAALDPVELARRAGFDNLDPWQRDLLRSDADRILVNVCRQGGKSLAIALLAVHTAVYRPNSVSLLLSPSERQSGLLARSVASIMQSLRWPIPSTERTQLTLTLSNRSRVVALPGSEQTIRGFTADLIAVDEAARVSDALVSAVRPMLAVSAGRLIMASTPFGTRGAFFESWISATPWNRIRVPATDCPRISSSFLAEERASLGEWSYLQEYMTEFQADAGAVFSIEDIEAAFDDSIRPLGLLGKDWH